MKKNTLGYSEYLEAINEGGRLADRWEKKENVYDAMTKIAKYTLSNQETPDEREQRLIKLADEEARISWEKLLQSSMIPISSSNRNSINLNNQSFSSSAGNTSTLSVSNPVAPTLNNESIKLREEAANKDYREYVRMTKKEDGLMKEKIRSFYGLDNTYVSSYFNKFLTELPVNFMKAIGL